MSYYRGMNQLINDVQENVRRFNQEEEVWRCFVEKQKKLQKLFPRRLKIADEILDRLAWAAAEREMQHSDCIGKTLP